MTVENKANLKCIPVCRNTCVNSHCIGNNQCKCNPDHYPVDHFRCLPICDPPCGENMACLKPNLCFCKPDFKKVNNTCEPVCSFTDADFECIHGKCISPNVCECYEGYRNVTEFQCEPICENCVNGECLAPSVCECHDGYEKISDDICSPVCDPPCINSVCTKPNFCKCNENFEKYLKSHECLEKNVIIDRQSCEKSCENGTCSDDGTCICKFGFEMFNEKCLAVCDKECVNGKCLEDQCVCPENYKLSENSTAECLPICAFEDGHDCIYGTCVAPQICKCFEGYRFLDDRNCTCVPMCDPPCINGVCTEHGCICHEHFPINISDHECIKNCSEGFTFMYDDCIDNDDFEIFQDTTTSTTSSEETFDIIYQYTTSESITSYEETSDDDKDEEDEGSADDTQSEHMSTTER
jgi:hypothetical protein